MVGPSPAIEHSGEKNHQSGLVQIRATIHLHHHDQKKVGGLNAIRTYSVWYNFRHTQSSFADVKDDWCGII